MMNQRGEHMRELEGREAIRNEQLKKEFYTAKFLVVLNFRSMQDFVSQYNLECDV